MVSRARASTIFSANFEDGSGGYSSDGFTYTTDTATSNLWHATTHRSVSPTHCQYYGLEGVYNYDTGARNAGNLVSPMISLEGVTPPITLSFKYLLQTENDFGFFDIATVEINAPGSGGWVVLATLSDSPTSFTTSNIDLSTYAGLPCFIRFKFDTIDNGLNDYEGWYIDDISIVGSGVTPQTNNWVAATSGKWETAANWSGGTPSSADIVDLITNINTKTVTIDATTVLSNSLNQCLTINNLVLSGAPGLGGVPTITPNALQLSNAGTATPLNITGPLTLGNGGLMVISNSALQVGSVANVGSSAGAGTLTLASGSASFGSNLVLGAGATAGSTGTLWVTGGQLSLSNPPSILAVGALGEGQVIVSNGTLFSRNLFVGTNQFSHGTITVAGGTLISSNVFFGLASNTFASVWINSGQFIATNRTEILGYYGSAQLTVSNSGTFIGTTMFVANHSPSAGTLTVAGGFANIFTLITGASNTTASTWVTGGGTLVSTNGGINVGALQSTCQLTISNSTVLTRDLTIASGLSSVGTLTMQGGTLSFSSPVSSNCQVAASTGAKGFVWINGGTVTATNNGCILYLGLSGPGQWALTNGSTTVGNLYCGTLASGTLTIAGGTFSVMGNSIVALDGPNLTGTVSLASGQLVATNGDFVLGCFGYAPLTVSGGTATFRSMVISSNYPASGVLSIPGGQVTVFDKLVVGDCASNAIGQITVNGGTLYVTNATHTGYLDIRGGALTLSGTGRVVVDRFVMTNSCGQFIHNGGTFVYGSATLDPNRDDDNDGLPNGWEQAYGLDPLDPNGNNGPNGDPDGDGMSNLQEYIAGTNPTNSASAFRIISLSQTGSDVLVTWTCAGGHSNVVQAASGAAGSYSNISPTSYVPGSGDVTNSYLDVGGATNRPNRFYRVTVVQPGLDHFAFSPISGTQTSGAPFTVTITAYDATNGVLVGYSGMVTLSVTSSVGSAVIWPALSPSFVGGHWTGPVTVAAPFGANVTMAATDGAGHTGQSNPFYIVGSATNVLIPVSSTPADVVADSARGLLYMTVSNQVLRYDLINQTFLSPFTLGGNLRGIDISPDNNTLVVADATFGGGSNWVDVVDLPTGTSRQAFFAQAGGEAGTWAVAFGYDGAALITSEYQGSAWTPMRRYDPVAGTVSTVANPRHRSMVSSSADGHTMVVAEADQTGGPLDRYNVTSQTISGSVGVSFYFLSDGAANRDGTQFTAISDHGAFIYDSNFTQVAQVSTSSGCAYDPQGDQLFLATSSTTYLRALETHTFTEIAHYDCGYTFPSAGIYGLQPGRTRLSRDGNNLFVTVGGGVRWISFGTGQSADLALSAVGSENPVPVGTNLTYTLAITNSGPSGVTDAAVYDSLPPGATFVSASSSPGAWTLSNGVVIATLGSLASGSTGAVSITVRSPGPAVLTNVALVTSSATDPNLVNNSSTLITAVQFAIAPGLTVTSPVDYSYTTNSSVTVIGTSSSPYGIASVNVNGVGASTADGYNHWSAVVAGLSVGTNALIATATDNNVPPDTATNVTHVIHAAGAYDGNGDGLADVWQLQYFGCVECPQAAPGADPDGDGLSNLQEFLAGTDPTSSASSFRITSVVRSGNDVSITWMMGPGKTNALQAAVTASYATNSFADIFTITNTVGSVTNYLDVGAATNSSPRFYRVRLVP